VGEAPGGNEDRTGEPFVGASGKKLDEWLAAAGLSRHNLFITNILKCWAGRKVPFPDDDECGGPVDRCLPFLHSQLRVVNPVAIIVAGRRALHHLILRGAVEQSVPFGPWVGKLLRRRDLFGETRIGVIWHPARILREYSPIDEQRCIDTIQRICAYAEARCGGEAAPLIDLVDVRPVGTINYQQRVRLFDPEPPTEIPT
jgi:uracil-DNA glycosylase family 4